MRRIYAWWLNLKMIGAMLGACPVLARLGFTKWRGGDPDIHDLVTLGNRGDALMGVVREAEALYECRLDTAEIVLLIQAARMLATLKLAEKLGKASEVYEALGAGD